MLSTPNESVWLPAVWRLGNNRTWIHGHLRVVTSLSTISIIEVTPMTKMRGSYSCAPACASIAEMTRRTLSLLLMLAFPFCSPAALSEDPDVKAAERLFTSWIRGQIAYRNLPGIAVGVVSDQQLVWAEGFGYADVDKKIPMTPTTKFRRS